MATSEPVKLIAAFDSPFVHRAEVALRLKGVPYELKGVPYELILLQHNPVHKKVPCSSTATEPRLVLFGDGEAQRSAMAGGEGGPALTEEQLKDKRFFGGDAAIGLADIAGGGLLAHWLGVLEVVAGVSVLASDSDEDLPALCRWAAEYRSSEAVKACLPDRARLLAYFAGVRDKSVSSRWPNRLGTLFGRP